MDRTGHATKGVAEGCLDGLSELLVEMPYTGRERAPGVLFSQPMEQELHCFGRDLLHDVVVGATVRVEDAPLGLIEPVALRDAQVLDIAGK